MRTLTLLLFFAVAAQAQDLEIQTRPEAIYLESLGGNLAPMERVFFHIIVRNVSNVPLRIEWIRFDLTNSEGVLLSGQYSGPALSRLFDSAIERRRIEPTPLQTTVIQPDQRKGISDIFFDYPKGFVGESVVIEVQYESQGSVTSQKVSRALDRVEGFSGRLPFDGIWYVMQEHGYLDQHKRFLAEAYAYDFNQIGANSKSYQGNGSRNSDYYAYGKKVLAAKDGVVVAVRSDILENEPGTPNTSTPGGNVVVIDHGNGQFGYYAHLRSKSVGLKVGAAVKAGDPVGEVGNSGESAEPSLHFHVMNNANIDEADGIPATFSHWNGQVYGHVPAARESGVLPRGEFVSP